MRKINYFTFLTEAPIEYDDNNSLSYDPNATLKGDARKSDFGCTVQTHEGTHLQFTHEAPGQIRVQEWSPNATNAGKILRGGSKVMPSIDAFNLAANRAVPEQQLVVPNHFRGVHPSAYSEFTLKRSRDQRATEQ